MSLTIAAGIELNGPIDPAATNGENRVARLVSTLVDLKSHAAVSEHLGHERHPLELAIGVQCLKDLLLTADLNPLADFQAIPARPVRALPHNGRSTPASEACQRW